jgi:hypothetical protein
LELAQIIHFVTRAPQQQVRIPSPIRFALLATTHPRAQPVHGVPRHLPHILAMAMAPLHMGIPLLAICCQGSPTLCKEAVVGGRRPQPSPMAMTGAAPVNADPLPLNPGDRHPRPDLSQRCPLPPPILQNKRQYSLLNIARMRLTRSVIKTKFERI